jgi:hypothetical protein
LGEIDDYGLTGFPSNKYIELVEITVNETSVSKSNNDVHQFGVQFSWRWQLGNLTP